MTNKPNDPETQPARLRKLEAEYEAHHATYDDVIAGAGNPGGPERVRDYWEVINRLSGRLDGYKLHMDEVAPVLAAAKDALVLLEEMSPGVSRPVSKLPSVVDIRTKLRDALETYQRGE